MIVKTGKYANKSILEIYEIDENFVISISKSKRMKSDNPLKIYCKEFLEKIKEIEFKKQEKMRLDRIIYNEQEETYDLFKQEYITNKQKNEEIKSFDIF